MVQNRLTHFCCSGSSRASSRLDGQSTPIPESTLDEEDLQRIAPLDKPSMSQASMDSEATFRGSYSFAGSAADDVPDAPEVVVDSDDNKKPRGRRKENAEELLATAMALYGLTDMACVWDPQLDTKAVLGWNKRMMVLAFRGTASFANAWSDLKVRPA